MIRPVAIALVAALAYVALGLTVSHAAPSGIDVAGGALAGEAPRVALFFTLSCRFEVLASLAAIGLVAAWRLPAWRARIVTAVVTMAVMWKVSDLLKNAFGRPRPPYWLLIHETSPSYSSGHALWATIVFWLWAWFVWHSTLPRAVRMVAAALLALWGAAVIWSRLALGAHYVTDLAGGVLLGIAALAVSTAIRTAGARGAAANSAP